MTRAVPILFVDHAAGLGGAQWSLLTLLEDLGRERFEPHLVTVPGELAEQARRLQVPVHECPMPRIRRSAAAPIDLVRGMRRIAAAARGIDAGWIYANTVRGALYALPAGKMAGIPTIWHVRDYSLSEHPEAAGPAEAALRNAVASLAGRIHAVSHAVASSVNHRDVRVMYCGIDLRKFLAVEPGSARTRASADIAGLPRAAGAILSGLPGAVGAIPSVPKEGPVVGMVGRLCEWKGGLTFAEAAARVAERAPGARFLVVGGTPLDEDRQFGERLRRRVDELGLGDRFVFTGHLADVTQAYGAMDVYVHPGAPEPFGRVIVEAMASGLPVVGFRHGSLPELVDDGATGLLVRPGDIAALADAVLRLIDRPEEARSMGARGRLGVSQGFTRERSIQEVERSLAEGPLRDR